MRQISILSEKQILRSLCVVLLIFPSYRNLHAQDISGPWQGVNYFTSTSDPNMILTLVLQITQTGNTFTADLIQVFGTDPRYYSKWNITGGAIENNQGAFELKNIYEHQTPPNNEWCKGTLNFTYYPDEEKIKGTVNYTNPACRGNVGTFEFYRIRLKSPVKYCKGEKAVLAVTGNNVTWYADKEKRNVLANGNSYTTILTETTAYYVTQKYYNVETPPVELKIEVGSSRISDIKVTPASCNDDNGTITLSAAGTGRVLYSIDNNSFQESPVFGGLPDGTYTIRVKDSMGCEATEEARISKNPLPIVNKITPENVSCNKINGSILVDAVGGYGSLLYSLDATNFQSNPLFQNLSVGEYEITVKDQLNCELKMMTQIAEEKGLKIDTIIVSNATCDLLNGSIAIMASDGRGQVSYSTNSLSYQSSPDFVNLKPGIYTIWVKDQSDCIVSKSAEVKNSLKTLTKNVNICQGQRYVVGDSTYTKSGVYLDKIYKNGICDSLITTNLTVTNLIEYRRNIAVCFGETYKIGDSLYTRSGTYTNRIRGSNNSCDSLITTVLTVSNPVTHIQDVEICEGESVTVGTERYTASGQYITKISRPGKCDSLVTTNLVVHKITITIPSITSIEFGDSVLLAPAIDPPGNYLYQWYPNDEISCDTCSSIWVKPLQTTSYELKVEIENYVCSSEKTIIVDVSTNCDVYLPAAFSPNGDGLNEIFYPKFGDCVQEISDFIIYNRLGEVVFKLSKFSTSDPGNGWNGNYQNLPLLYLDRKQKLIFRSKDTDNRIAGSGTYYYKLDLRSKSNKLVKKSGTFLLVR